MRYSAIDFNTIERALSYTIEALELEQNEELQSSVLEELVNAKEELKRALSYSLSRMNG
ncbi:hypothetical protein PZE06_06215 [Robertmurraya sp. DFI.2.37]|uniref:hypothetical protein n=1 Tax=Robertmurraya sp. DFI.2.37 TaxID=3031819 RepID=UPI001780E148|nr:hypothetical protein [Robertmurraya sp. DFI.2.37]MDF1507776.1 hypothetical protein [Robertmurraya sp. DFI.2.37]